MAGKRILKWDVVSTDKKHRALVMRAKGYSNAHIAKTLGLSEATVVRILNVSERS